jgi:tetratricopeptide (TPR) repeat protein
MVDMMRAILLAMSDRVDEAREIAVGIAKHARELGNMVNADAGLIEGFSGDHEAAAEQYAIHREWVSERVRSAEAGYFSALEGRELVMAGRYDEAEEHLAKALQYRQTSRDGEALHRQVAALIAAHRGEHAEAERLAREGLTLILEGDSPLLQGDAYFDLAEVLEAAGCRDEAVTAWHEALSLYERKGIIPLARRVRERLASLESV